MGIHVMEISKERLFFVFFGPGVKIGGDYISFFQNHFLVILETLFEVVFLGDGGICLDSKRSIIHVSEYFGQG